jgi:CRISPR-associated protein Csh1
VTTGISLKILKDERELYLRDFEIIRNIIVESGTEGKSEHNGTISKSKKRTCSVTGKIEDNIYGFAAPFKYSSPDKPGFISGFFNKKMFWRNYPVSSKEALALEFGKKYIQQNLSGYFYGHEYFFVPHPIIKTDNDKLESIIILLQTSLQTENAERQSKEKKKRADDRVQKIIGGEDNFFYLDILFYSEDKKTGAISIDLMLEEILPSRFRKLFIHLPEKVDKKPLFHNAIKIKNEIQDLHFSFQIVRNFFDKSFLDVVQRIFLGKPISKIFVYEKIIKQIQKNYNERKTQEKWTEPTDWTIKKAIMLLTYLQELSIIQYNKTYQYMETDTIEKKEGRFNLAVFNEFVKSNAGFLDSDIKVGIFAVGVLVRFLFDIQQANLRNTPFENKLRGYKLNSELLTTIYSEALDKIQKYQKNFYVYADLREIINQYFILKKHEITSLNNNEISFFFVSGLEMGRRFKNEKEQVPGRDNN